MQKIIHTIVGSGNKPISIDIQFQSNKTIKPIVLFCHGFKGFKNWGHFDLISDYFAQHGFVFVKFNFAWNGTTLEHPIDFVDLDAFGRNNFSKELEDIGLVLDFLENNATTFEADKQAIYLIGHSRGGGVAILKTKEDNRIKKLITWASIKNIADFFSTIDMDKWKIDGVVYTLNGRTQQNMPLYYQLYEDYRANNICLDIAAAAKMCTIPWLILHGTNDTSVPFSCATYLSSLNAKSILLEIENADHTFGGKHPWKSTKLPEDTIRLVEATMKFILEN